MKVRNIESGLAWMGALVVMIGVSFAAGNAFGAEPVADDGAATSISEAAAVAIAGARDANAMAAADAAAAIARNAARGLEIEIADYTLKLMADAP